MTIERLPNETDLAYHRRLINGKLVDKTIDLDYSELAEAVYGQEYSSDVARRMMYGSSKTLQLMDREREADLPQDMLSELDQKMIQLQKERQRFFDQRNALSKIVREQARQDELEEILIRSIENGRLPKLSYEYHDVPLSDNDLLVSLNDMHYGANVDNFWNTYNPDECRAMIGRYLEKIFSIAKTHGSENCIVWQNGDSISGNIHYSIAVTNKENVVEQICGVSELIAQFLATLSEHFRTVTYVSVAGNHSRINPNKDQSLASERLDDLVEWYLAARLQNYENIMIGGGAKIDSTMYLIDIRGKTYCGVHGDFDGSQAKIQALQAMTPKPLYAILSGHLHHNKIDQIQNVKTIMAGSFLGMDDYCVQNRIVGVPEQMVCVCDNHGVRCSYSVDLRRYPIDTMLS